MRTDPSLLNVYAHRYGERFVHFLVHYHRELPCLVFLCVFFGGGEGDSFESETAVRLWQASDTGAAPGECEVLAPRASGAAEPTRGRAHELAARPLHHAGNPTGDVRNDQVRCNVCYLESDFRRGRQRHLVFCGSIFNTSGPVGHTWRKASCSHWFFFITGIRCVLLQVHAFFLHTL